MSVRSWSGSFTRVRLAPLWMSAMPVDQPAFAERLAERRDDVACDAQRGAVSPDYLLPRHDGEFDPINGLVDPHLRGRVPAYPTRVGQPDLPTIRAHRWGSVVPLIQHGFMSEQEEMPTHDRTDHEHSGETDPTPASLARTAESRQGWRRDRQAR